MENFNSYRVLCRLLRKFNEDDKNEKVISRFSSGAFVFIDVFSFRVKREGATIDCGLVVNVSS